MSLRDIYDDSSAIASWFDPTATVEGWEDNDLTAGVAGGDVSVNVTGVFATGSVGTVTVTGTAVVSPTGNAGTGSAGTVTVTGFALVDITGLFGTGSAGTTTATGDCNVFLTGVSASAAVGDESIYTTSGMRDGWQFYRRGRGKR